MHLNIQHLLHHYGYWGVFFILLIEMIGIPFPAETTLTLSGFEWANGAFNLFPLLIAASIGNIIGSTIAYGIGRLLGRPVIVRFGKYVGITHERLDNSSHLFHKFQRWFIILCKFVAGIRVFIPYVAGINEMNFVLFSILNAISAFLWATLFIFLGRYIGIEWLDHYKIISKYFFPWGIVLLIIAVLAILLRRWHKNKN
ncbi:MAG TPA: DedA family protein [Balneolaceae bacterium]|nr:DedA family protein [Balneolaceae bacterium]